MSVPRRSTTGCGLCKTRRKKCDETKPQCLRCLASRKTCSYEYIEYSVREGHRVKRTKPAPRITGTRGLLTNEPLNISDGARELTIPPSLVFPDSGDVAPQVYSGHLKAQPSYGVSLAQGTTTSLSLSLIPSAGSWSQTNIGSAGPSLPPLGLVRVPNGLRHVYHTMPNSSPHGFEKIDPNEEPNNDKDPERIRAALFRFLTVDKSVKENTLPFVLHCYFEWALTNVFEPLKIVHTIREQVIAQFSSENTRTRSIMIANVMNMFAKNLVIDGTRKSILNRLDLDVRKRGAALAATPPSPVPALDRQNAIHILDNMLEIVGLQLDTLPTSNIIRSLRVAAPIFQRACLEPPGRPINLPNLLLDLSLNLRHFATIDIIMSVMTGLPTRFQYEVPFSLELCERISRWQKQGNYGLQWLYGLPDQYLLLFAWVNTMSETPGAGDNTELIASVERLLLRIKIPTDQLGDPSLYVGRMVVLESWRYTALIYLYMVLCKAKANDPRVVRAHAGFMNLVNTAKPGRYPDVYLIISYVVVGVAATEERDRNTLRQRILGIREYAEQRTVGNDTMLALEEIWARTRDEGRAAVWLDLTTTFSRLAIGR